MEINCIDWAHIQTLPLNVLRAVKQEQTGGAVVKMEHDRIQSPESPTMMDDRKNASNEPINIPTERKGSKNYSYDGSSVNHRRSYEERSDYHRSSSSSSRSHRYHRDRRSRTPERRSDYGSRQNSGSRDRDHYSRDHKHERDSRVSLDRDRDRDKDRNRDRDYDSYRARSSHKTDKFDDSKRSVDRSCSRSRYQNPFAVSDRSDRNPSAEQPNNKSVFGRLGAKIHERNDETAADPLNDDVINELDEANDQRFGRVDDNKALLENYQKYKTILQLSKDLKKEEKQKAHNDMLNELAALQAANTSPDEDATAALSPDGHLSGEISGDDVPPHQGKSSPAIVPPAQERVALKYNPKPRKRFDSNESSSPIAVQNTPSSTYTPTAAAETQFDSIRLRTNNRDPRSVSNGPVPLPNNGNPFAKQNNCNATPAPPHHPTHAPPHHQQHVPPHHQTHVPSHHPPHVPVHMPPGPHMPHMSHAAMHPMHGPMHLPPMANMLSSNGVPMRNHPPHPPNFFIPPNRQPASNHFNEAPMFGAPNESNQFGMHSPPVGPPFLADGQFYSNLAPRRQTYADHKRQLELEKKRESGNYRVECVSSTTNSAASAPADVALNSNESILVTTSTQSMMSPTAASTPTTPAAPSTTQNPPPKTAPNSKRIEHAKKEEAAKSAAPPPPKSILDNAFRANNWSALSPSSSDHHRKKAQFKIPKLNRSDSSHSKSDKKTSDKKSDENTSAAVKSTAHKTKSSKHSNASHQDGKKKPSMRRRKSSSARETAVPTSSSSASSSPLPVTEIDDTSETTTADNVATPAPTAAEKTPLTKEDLGQAIEDLLANLLKPSGDPLPSTVQSIIGAERIQQLKERLGLNKSVATNGDDSAVSSSTAPVAEKSTDAPQTDQNGAADSEPKPVRRPRKKQMNELEKLQENLDSTFIRNEVLAATGKRSCTLEQNQRSLAAKKPPTPTKPKAKIAPKNANDSDASSGKQNENDKNGFFTVRFC